MTRYSERPDAPQGGRKRILPSDRSIPDLYQDTIIHIKKLLARQRSAEGKANSRLLPVALLLTSPLARGLSEACLIQPQTVNAADESESLLTPDVLKQGLMSCTVRGFVQVRMPDFVVVSMSRKMQQYFELCPFMGPVGQPLFHFIHPCDARCISASACAGREVAFEGDESEEDVKPRDVVHACVRLFTFGRAGIRCLPCAVSYDRSTLRQCSTCVLEFEPLEEKGEFALRTRSMEEIKGIYAFDELRSHDGNRHGPHASCVQVEDALYGAGGEEMVSEEALTLVRHVSKCFSVNEEKLLARMLQMTLSIVMGKELPKWRFLRFRLSLPCILGQLKTEWRSRHNEEVEMNGRDSSSSSSSSSTRPVFVMHESDGSANLCFSEFTFDDRREQSSLHASRLYRVSNDELYCCGVDRRRKSSHELRVYEHWWNAVKGDT
eukprot:723040-Hanusia_phi.AAC.3